LDSMEKKTLHELFDEMYHGKHDFDEFMHADIDLYYQATGKKNFYIPNKKLKAFHTFLNLFVFEFLPINDRIVFSYRKGFSAYDAVEPHSKSKYFFQTDISSFFASITRELVDKTLRAGLDDCPVADLSEWIERILDLVCVDGVLPVGFPSSAPISNAVLFAFDNELEKYCEFNNSICTRYSDDIIVSSDEKSNLSEVNSAIEEFLNHILPEQFRLNRGKSRYFQVGGRIKILGMMILPNGKITLDSVLKRNLEVLLYAHVTDKSEFHRLSEGDEEKGLGRVTGYLNYANSIDQDYIDKLRKRFGATIVDTLLHRPLPKAKSAE